MRTVFFDVDTQLDFLCPAGALYVPTAERIIPAVARLNRYAAANCHQVVSTADAHAENDPEFANWPPHCIAGALGQRKHESTLLERRLVVSASSADSSLEGIQQVIVEKQTVDVFLCRSLPAVLERLKADRYVLYGVVTEICVLSAARGLLATGKAVSVVTDAVEALRAEDSARALTEIVALGGMLATTPQICG